MSESSYRQDVTRDPRVRLVIASTDHPNVARTILWLNEASSDPRAPPGCTESRSRAVKRAGLPEGTTSHDLRHHYASVLLAAGESIVAVAERLGHENSSLVLSTYGHLMPDSEDRTRRAIDEAWSATLDGLDTASEVAE